MHSKVHEPDQRPSERKPVNYNQLVRWIMNKEDHANQLQEIVTQFTKGV